MAIFNCYVELPEGTSYQRGLAVAYEVGNPKSAKLILSTSCNWKFINAVSTLCMFSSMYLTENDYQSDHWLDEDFRPQ